MARFPIAYLAAGALGLTGSAAAAADPVYNSQLPPAPWTTSNPPPFTQDYRASQSAMDAPQMFKFPGLSNKSTSLSRCSGGGGKGHDRAKVVATFPGEGAVVRPGLVVVRVTFDQPMSCDASFDGTSDLPNPCPGRWREATLSQDRRSFRTVCEVQPNTRYRLTLRSFHNGRGLAAPHDVTFVTSGAAPIATIQQALAEDVGVAGG